MELTEGDSLEGSYDTSMYKPHIVSLMDLTAWAETKIKLYNRNEYN